MHVELTPELERLIEQRVEAGDYRSASEVVREGLALLFAWELPSEEERVRVRAMIQEGVDELDRGEGIPGEQVEAEMDALLESLRRGTAYSGRS